MTTRETAIAIVHGIGKGLVPLAAFADDATWWMLGRGALPVRRMAEIVRAFHAGRVASEGRMDIVGITDGDDRVAVEATATYPLHDGTIYKCDYHIMLRFKNDSVCEVREYFDTAHAAATFASGPAAATG